MSAILFGGSLCINLGKALKQSTLRLSNELNKQGLKMSTAEAYILYSLSATDGVTMSELAQSVSQSCPNIYTSICSLVDKGYIERRQRPKNKRVVQINLTNKGKLAGQIVSELIERVDRQSINGLSEIEMGGFYRVLNQLMESST